MPLTSLGKLLLVLNQRRVPPQHSYHIPDLFVNSPTVRTLSLLPKLLSTVPTTVFIAGTPTYFLYKKPDETGRAYHVLTVHQSHSIGDYFARINSRAVFPIPNIEKLIVFIKIFIQYLVFFILIGLSAHYYPAYMPKISCRSGLHSETDTRLTAVVA